MPVPEEAPLPVPPQAEPGRPLKILVVDDSEDNRSLMRAYLKKTPHRSEFAENGEEALRAFQLAGDFDLVLMDIQMPVMDGHAATRAIRAWEEEEGRGRTRVFALSAHAMEEEIRASLSAGCDDHLTKPIKKAVLLDTLAAVARAVQDAETASGDVDSREEKP